jgi:hypothetical protein
MARAQRFDLHRLDGPEVLPSGALRVPARVAKIGVLRYQDSDGNTWGELVPPETLFDPASMATLRGVALTDLHPGALVTPETRKGLQVGHVGDTIAQDGAYLSAPVYVTDAEAIARVQSGERKDVSSGYECELDETPGTFNGKPYARIQRDRVYNHVGIGPEGWGRAGTDVSLRLDGADSSAGSLAGESVQRIPVARLDSGDSHAATSATPAAQEPLPGAQKTSTDSHPTGSAAPITAPEKGQRSAMAQPKTNAKKDGDEMPPKDAEKDPTKKDADMQPGEKIDSPDLGAQLDAANNALMEAMKTIAMLKAQLAVTEATKPEVTEESVPEMIADSIVAKRLAKLVSATTDAKLVAPAVKLDGLVSTRKVHEAALALVVPEMKFDGLTDDRVAGMFDALAATAKKAAEKGAEKGEKRQDGKSVRNDALGAAHRAAAGEPGEKPADTVEDAIRKMHQDSCDDWKRATPALRVATTIQAD